MVDLGEKMKTHVSKISPRSRARNLALGEVEESQGFTKVKHSKSKNGFSTTYSLSQKISETIFNFPIR